MFPSGFTTRTYPFSTMAVPFSSCFKIIKIDIRISSGSNPAITCRILYFPEMGMYGDIPIIAETCPGLMNPSISYPPHVSNREAPSHKDMHERS